MGLTEAKLKDLTDKDFDKLYAKHKKVWVEAANNAVDFVKATITGGKRPEAG